MELKVSEVLHTLPILAIFAFNIKGISGTCPPPDEASRTDDFSQLSIVQTEYVINHVVVFSCLSEGYGYFTRTCESSGGSSEWSEFSRQCGDQIPFDYGSLVGILCGAFTLVVSVVLIVLSTRLKNKRDKEEQMELKIMETAGATKA